MQDTVHPKQNKKYLKKNQRKIHKNKETMMDEEFGHNLSLCTT